MRLAVIGDFENGVDELIKYGKSVGFDMVHTNDDLPHEIAASAHAVIYIAKNTIAEARERINLLADKMRMYGIRRIVIHTPTHATRDIDIADLDWTVINDSIGQHHASTSKYDHNFARFVIGQVTDSQHVNCSVTRPISD